MASQRKNKKEPKKINEKNNSSIFDFVQGSNIEIIVAALLLTGKLRFDSIVLYREASLIINLVGQFETLVDLNSDDIDGMLKLFKDKENLTISSIIEEFKRSSDK